MVPSVAGISETFTVLLISYYNSGF